MNEAVSEGVVGILLAVGLLPPWGALGVTGGLGAVGASNVNATLFPCSVCGKIFYKRNTMIQHKLNLHGKFAGPYNCPDCGKKLKNRRSLHMHVRDIHKRYATLVTVQGRDRLLACSPWYEKFSSEKENGRARLRSIFESLAFFFSSASQHGM